MPTDDERRQMSDALRRCVKGREYGGDDVMAELVRSIAVSVGLTPDADPTAQDLCDRLADLVEPSCDRRALLELAAKMDGDTLAVPLVYGSYQSGYIAAMGDCARRIREALGEAGR